MLKRSALIWLLLCWLATVPVMALEFRSWRTDGVQVRGSSARQQSSNAGYNQFDTLTDPSNFDFSLYWMGARHADAAPSDNRPQETSYLDGSNGHGDWNAWRTSILRPTAVEPTFTPNVPQGWSPVVGDLDDTGNQGDHLLLNVTFEPVAPRHQVIAAYWPETARGLGDLTNNNGQVRPAWTFRTLNLQHSPGTSVGSTAESTGVVTHAPILTSTGGFDLLYVVVGTGENLDPARVFCLRVPNQRNQGIYQVPNLTQYGSRYDATNNPDGGVMWSYTVTDRSGSGITPVAGISFADVGDTTGGLPLLYVTTKDGQVICLNAKPIDDADIAADGDPKAGEVRWKFETTAIGIPGVIPEFKYGMAPAVARVPLTAAYYGTVGQQVVSEALATWKCDEFLVYVADDFGVFRAFDARGVAIDASGAPDNPLTRWKWRIRWENVYTDPVTGNVVRRPSPVGGEAERFINPPVVYQGGTPMTNSGGLIVGGSSDSGYDDQVIFPSERGRVYVLDALGTLGYPGNVGNTVNGRPPYGPETDPLTGLGTEVRWTWPTDDTALTPGNSDEPRVWPRRLDNTLPTPAALGAGINLDADFYSRSPLSVSLGANANPDAGSPNLDPGDDRIFVPYMERVAGAPAGKYNFHEYIGSLQPYHFVQAEEPIGELKIVQVRLASGAVIRIGADPMVGAADQVPVDRVFRVGTVKPTAEPRTSPNVGRTPDDTVYLVDPTFFYPVTGQVVTIPTDGSATITLIYDEPDGTPQTNANLPFPSAYVDVSGTIARRRPSLSVDYGRLQLQSRQTTGATAIDEAPAQVSSSLFDNRGWRPGAMMAAGGGTPAGLLFAPSWYRGRIIAFTHRLRMVNALEGNYDERLDAGTTPVEPFTLGDPGAFVAKADGSLFTDEMPELTDVGSGSVTVVDGWLYVTYQNGHTRAYSVEGGGAPGTIGTNPNGVQNRPIRRQTPPNNMGTGVKAPVSIRLLQSPTQLGVYRDALGLDRSVMVEWGETLYAEVDFGPANLVISPQQNMPPLKPEEDVPYIDPIVLQNDLRGSVRSTNNGQVSAPPNIPGIKPTVQDRNGQQRVIAVVPIFVGYPSNLNPLTPGTPLLWERQSDAATSRNEFQGELIYSLRIEQPGVQWVWGPYRPVGGAPPAGFNQGNQTHFWETERNSGQTPPMGQTPVLFPTTGGTTTGAPGGTPKWQWVDSGGNPSPWAPLISYNNPIVVYYDPTASGDSVFGMYGATNVGRNAVPSDPATPAAADQVADAFTSRLDSGRKNGDEYAPVQGHPNPVVDGARSGSGRPVIPTVGVAISGNSSRQLLYGEHGKTTPADATGFPGLALLRVGDRSFLSQAGQPLTLRIQRAPLTKIGRGAYYGGLSDPQFTNPNARPVGSAEQNAGALDDEPSGYYGSIPENRVLVTKAGTSIDLSTQSIPVTGRQGQNNVLPTIAQLEQIQVQVDIPRFTADDLYATRWRTARQDGKGMDPQTAFNPFFPFNAGGSAPWNEAGRQYWDRSERRSRPVANTPTEPTGEDPGNNPADLNPAADDRFRRIVIYNDANNNGVLDLTPDRREAYRTFAVQVMVKPDMKLEAQQQVLDFGNLWHGKKQPGLPQVSNTGDIREWQHMQAAQGGGSPTMPPSVATFYRQYWRPFNLLNTGNVNLAYIKPEVVYQRAGLVVPQLIGLPAEGNDPWRALPIINANSPASLSQPEEIFLRTSFDDQLLPNNSTFYGGGQRGVWLQKAAMGAGQPGSVVYADQNAVPSGLALDRDPSALAYNWRNTRETFMTLNLPLGTPLGQYSGSIRFFNDKTVKLIEDSTSPVGYRYVAGQPQGNPPAQAASGDGILQRDATGEPLEPYTDPPLRIRARVIENMFQGRHRTAQDPRDLPDLRQQPAAIPDLSQSTSAGTVRRILMAYTSNRPIPNQVGIQNPLATDIFGAQLLFNSQRMLFPYDELPLDRMPWGPITGYAPANPGDPFYNRFTPFQQWALNGPNGVPITGQATRPSAAQNPNAPLSPNSEAARGLIGWIERRSTTQGNQDFRVVYRSFAPSSSAPDANIVLLPGGRFPEPRLSRAGVRMAVAHDPQLQQAANWFAFYTIGLGTRRNLAYTTTTDPVTGAGQTIDPSTGQQVNVANWTPEHTLATSRSLAAVNDPSVFITDQLPRAAPLPLPTVAGVTPPAHVQSDVDRLPQMAWTAYSGTSQRTGRTDIYLTRYRTSSLVTAGMRGGGPDPLGAAQDFAQVPFASSYHEKLVANPTRTLYTSSGLDWMMQAYRQTQFYLVRPDFPANALGGAANPMPFLNVGQVGQVLSSGEVVFPLATAPTNLRGRAPGVRITVDPAAGTVRLSADLRTLARVLMAGSNPPLTPASPDPILLADFTASTLRVTRGDVAASNPVIVPVMTTRTGPTLGDASWYLQQNDGTKWANGVPVAGRTDRLWVFWRRASGAVTGGPTIFYKILRPGIRLSAGSIMGVRGTEIQVNGGNVRPEEVNPANGTLYFPNTYEGQLLRVTYNVAGAGGVPVQVTEDHVVNWIDETGELPVPMEASINEGSVDAFPSFEDVQMSTFGQGLATVRKLERMWVFWSSTRGSGGDLYYATLAPRVGPEANVGGSVTLFSAGAARMSGLAPNVARQRIQTQIEFERRKPFTVPPIVRRGPLAVKAGLAPQRR